MISKGLRGASLGGLVRYLFGPGRAEEHTNQRVVACSDETWIGTTRPGRDELKQLIGELDDSRVRHGDFTKRGYVYHVPISIEAGAGALSDDQWRDVAATFAGKLNLDEGVSWVAVHHGPSINGNDHIHLVVNLIRDNGTEVNLWRDRLRRVEAHVELEKKFGLQATSAPGQGVAALSRAEVDRVRSAKVGSVEDLTRHRLATLVRGVATGVRSEQEFVERLRGEGVIVSARYAKDDRSTVTGYRVALKGGPGEKPLWFGGGTLGKDLRLPALRSRWHDGGPPPGSPVWEGAATLLRKANAEHVAAASDALGEAGWLMERVPVDDRAGWARLTSDAAGVLAAAAAATPNVVLQRELTRAWQAVNRCVRPSDPTAAADAAVSESGVSEQVSPSESAVEWPQPARFDRPVSEPSREASTLLAGASRVLMASRMADAPSHVRVAALVAQAAQLAAQMARTAAARADATAAERRALAACEAAAATAVRPAPAASMWQYPPRSPAEAAELQEAQTPIQQAPDAGLASRPEPGLDR